MTESRPMPPGQKARADFPRFGLPQYANRFPSSPDDRSITIEFNGNGKIKLDDPLADLSDTTMRADFHCVTTWTYRDATWGGAAFTDFFEKCVQPLDTDKQGIEGAVLIAQDGYRTSLLMQDLLSPDVMLVNTLDGQPLSIEHGAPLRLVVPQHYGYKNLKHLKRIEFFAKMPVLKRGVRAFLDHPRARVQKEERGRWVPGWVLRYLFRPMIRNTEKKFRQAMIERDRS